MKDVFSQNLRVLLFRKHFVCVRFSFDIIKLSVESVPREKPLSAGTFHGHDVPYPEEVEVVFLVLNEKGFCITTQGHPCCCLDLLIPCSIKPGTKMKTINHVSKHSPTLISGLL